MQSDAEAVVSEARSIETAHGGGAEPNKEPSLADLTACLHRARDLAQRLLQAASAPAQEGLLQEIAETTGGFIAKLGAKTG